MHSNAARRLNALILSAVLLFGGSGASALDVALYHLGGQVEAAATRVAGTDTPRPHGDACALLDWAARGPYTATLERLAALSPVAEASGARALRVEAPRPADLSAAPRPRAPPLQLS